MNFSAAWLRESFNRGARAQLRHHHPDVCAPQRRGSRRNNRRTFHWSFRWSSRNRARPKGNDFVVGPGGVHTFNDYKRLVCPTGINSPLGAKGEFPNCPTSEQWRVRAAGDSHSALAHLSSPLSAPRTHCLLPDRSSDRRRRLRKYRPLGAGWAPPLLFRRQPTRRIDRDTIALPPIATIVADHF